MRGHKNLGEKKTVLRMSCKNTPWLERTEKKKTDLFYFNTKRYREKKIFFFLRSRCSFFLHRVQTLLTKRNYVGMVSCRVIEFLYLITIYQIADKWAKTPQEPLLLLQ